MDTMTERQLELQEEQHEQKELIFNEGIIIVFLMLITYMGFEAFKHKHHIRFGHEASLVTLLGFGISFIFLYFDKGEFAELMSFSDDLFFYFCLPPIVFASGFNMQRKKFFQNIRNIVLFGLIGTIIAFVSFSGMTILYRDKLRSYWFEGDIMQEDGSTGIRSVLTLSTLEILLMCSLLCSTDVIAAVSLINPAEKPKLFSLVFGEGITNDAVSIILFNTVVKFTQEESDFTAGSTVVIGQDFATLGLKSIGCGIFFGLLCSYTLKRIRTLTKSPVSECAMIFCFA